ncbi:MAG TPA: selenide, water dikinase SelD, partial [Thermoanaerobaculia bacterium]|nr:selenide, water dikinase SelD [Thermoanaerobaculia bacterium]
MVAPLVRLAGRDERILVGADTADDAGVYLHNGHALVATVDFITPVCDDPRRFGRVAAANSLSDVFAMGGRALFALNICCFPELEGEGKEALSGILQGAAEAVAEAGAVLLGGHSVRDDELKFGLAVIGEADRDRLLTNAGARPGDRLLLTKPLGTGILVNAYKAGKIDEEGLEPALREMERLNTTASRLALEHGVHSATDVTGFGLTGHALGIAKASGVGIRFTFERLPVHEDVFRLIKAGVTTGCTVANEDNVRAFLTERARLDRVRREILFDPQTSGGLLLSTPPEQAPALLDALL